MNEAIIFFLGAMVGGMVVSASVPGRRRGNDSCRLLCSHYSRCLFPNPKVIHQRKTPGMSAQCQSAGKEA